MNLTSKLRAGYPGLYIVTHEEQRAEAMLQATVAELKAKHNQQWSLFGWTIAQGRFDITTGEAFDEDQLGVLDAVAGLPEKSILVLKDYHLILGEPNPLVYRKLKDALLRAKTENKCVIILAPRLLLTQELEKMFSVVDLPLPTRDELEVVLKGICEGNGKKLPKGDDLITVLDAAKGLTSSEAEDAFALSIVEKGKIEAAIVAREKSNTIKKNGILELVDTSLTFADIGGFDVTKTWVERRRNAFGDKAKKYKLPTPKGFLVTGIQGTGKSVLAKATAHALGGIPLAKLDAGAIFAGHVGESEANMRHVIKLAEAIAPCVLWIDELEKGFNKNAGAESDGGTSGRVFSTLLQWMSDKTASVFIVATANEAHKLDPALVRKGRFDEIFFVDLPNEAEREQIWRIQFAKWERKAEQFDLAALVEASAGATGAEIEAVFNEALFVAFDHGCEPDTLDIVEQLGKDIFVPLSKMMAEDVKALQAWAKGRARLASTPTATTKTQRKLAP